MKLQKVYVKKTTLSSLKQTVKPSLCGYSNAYILATNDKVVNGGNDTDVALKHCAPFSTCKTDINNVFVDEANQIYITMPTYKLIEYSDNYSDSSESFWQLKTGKVPAKNNDGLTIPRF